MSEVFVKVLYDFCYHAENGSEIKILAGEDLLLIKKSNKHWWQVIRNSDEQPFYAPSNSLSITGLKPKETSNSTDVNLNFIDILDSNCYSRITDNALHINQNSGKTFDTYKSNVSFGEISKEDYHSSTLLRESTPNFNNFKCTSTSDILVAQEFQSPIYLNTAIHFQKLPPTPKTDEKPLRKLSDNWFEYIEEVSGRKYYFHAITRKVTWKPPRRLENMQLMSLISEPSSPKCMSLNKIPNPPPKQLKPKLKKLAFTGKDNSESQIIPSMFTILPPGWRQISDTSTGTTYYNNEATHKKWFSSLDENGHTYFYDEDNCESAWELPNILTSDNEFPEISLQDVHGIPEEMSSSPKLRKVQNLSFPQPYQTQSMIVQDSVDFDSDDNKEASSFAEGYWPSVQPSVLPNTTALSENLSWKIIKPSKLKSIKYCTSEKSNLAVEFSIATPVEKKRKIKEKLRKFFLRRPSSLALREKGILLDEAVFGCHLENLCSRENTRIPKFVSRCIEIIEEKELTADGLYRASGNLSQIQKIRILVNQDDYSCLRDEEDVHVLTGALKMFFREMKEPLFPFHMFDKFLHAVALPDSSSKLEAIKKLIVKMPDSNYETLKTLLKHLLRVTEFHKQNRMQIQNVAIVFGPTLMWPEYVSSNLALDMMHQNRIVEFLLLEFKAIFDSELMGS